MQRYALRRALHGLVVILGVTTLVFVVTRLIGDPVRVMLPVEATASERAAFAARLGLDRPIAEQYVDFLGDVARLRFGTSLWQDRPAAAIVAETLPNTLLLVAVAMVAASLIGIAAGAYAGAHAGRAPDRWAVAASLLGLSVPQFWLGLLLIVVFAVQLGWLPASGNEGSVSLVLPTLALALPSAGRIALVSRSQLIDVLHQPYIRAAEARGAPFLRILWRHAARNAANPIVTVIGWETIRMLAGYAIVVETVFAWPGLGLLAVQAIARQDLILLQAIVFTVALIVVLINLGVDLVYRAIDPRAAPA